MALVRNMSDNPFIKKHEKKQDAKTHARIVMLGHVVALEALYGRISDDEPSKARIGKRLAEAREDAKHYA